MAHVPIRGGRKSLVPTDYTVAIVCPLEVEMSAMRYMLDEEHIRLPNVEGDRNSYVFGEISGHNIVIGFLPHGSQGIGAAASVATNMRRTFPSIRRRLLVGIAGGIPNKAQDVRLGDVVVSMPSSTSGGVEQYDLGKETANGFERKGVLEPPPREWRDAVVLMMSDHRMQGNQIDKYISDMLKRYPRLSMFERPKPSEDLLFAAASMHVDGATRCDQCDQNHLIYRTDRTSDGSEIFVGLIASGDRVVKNGTIRDQIGLQSGGALCVEMEAAGLMNDFHCIVIRGICDYADSHKNDRWHTFAAAAAAACAKELLAYITPISESQILAKSTRISMVPKQKIHDFFGREEELLRISTCFSDNASDQPRRLDISGLGGQGKTQLVLEYCHRHRQKYRGIFWINATTMSTITHSFAMIAGRLDLAGSVIVSDEDARARFVVQTFEHWRDRCLVIFDGCNDSQLLKSINRLSPTAGRVDIVITTRIRGQYASSATYLEVSSMLPVDAVELLLHGCTGNNASDHLKTGTEIVNRLGRLPLAVKQASEYIQDQSMPIDALKEFVKVYNRDRTTILSFVPDGPWAYGAFHHESPAQDKTCTFNTWETSLSQLKTDHPLQAAAIVDVLTLAAISAPIAISDFLFKFYWEATEDYSKWMRIFVTESPPSANQKDRAFDPPSELIIDAQKHFIWSQEKFVAFTQLTRKYSLTQFAAPEDEESLSAFSLHVVVRDWLQLRGTPLHRSAFAKEAFSIVTKSLKDLDYDDELDVELIEQHLIGHMNAILRYDDEYTPIGLRIGEVIDEEEDFGEWIAAYTSCQEFANALKICQRARKVVAETKSPRHWFNEKYACTFAMLQASHHRQDLDTAVKFLEDFCQWHRSNIGIIKGKSKAGAARGMLEQLLVEWIDKEEWNNAKAEMMLRQALIDHFADIEGERASWTVTMKERATGLRNSAAADRKGILELMYRCLVNLYNYEFDYSGDEIEEVTSRLVAFLKAHEKEDEAAQIVWVALCLKDSFIPTSSRCYIRVLSS